jgi:hypothetical protein
MPDGRHITAAEQGQLPLVQDISQNAAVAYKIPLLSQSLLSIGKLCDNNCTATFSKTDCVIKHNKKIIITGKRDPTNSLWKIPIVQNNIRHDPPISEGAQKIDQNRKILRSQHSKMNYTQRPISEGERISNTRKIFPQKQKFPVNYQHPISEGVNSISYVEKVTDNITKPKNVLNNLEQIKSKKGIIDFLHTALFSPVKSTWLRAIRRNHFITWPGINSHDVAKYLQPTTATAKGYLDRRIKNIKSTIIDRKPAYNDALNQNRKNIKTTIIDNKPAYDDENQNYSDVAPQPEEKTENVFIAFLSADTQGTVYTDLTGRFPVTSRTGNK